MGIKLGSTDISKVFVGSTAAQKVYLGSTQVWSSQIVYDATGAGKEQSSGATAAYSHTIAGNAILCAVETKAASGVTAKVGATPVNVLATVNTGTASVYLWVFGLVDPPTGAQTINLAGLGANTSANSVSYKNVTSIGTAVTATGASGATETVTASSAPGKMVFNAMAMLNNSAPAYNQTQRSLLFTSGTDYPLLLGDAPGASSVTFSCASSAAWAAVAVPLS